MVIEGDGISCCGPDEFEWFKALVEAQREGAEEDAFVRVAAERARAEWRARHA